jgi:calcineurin-like phosphoesterase family protein
MTKWWQRLVLPDDIVLHLGDVGVWYGGNEHYWRQHAGSLPGKKFLIKGNHDRAKDKLFEAAGFTIIPEFVQEFEFLGRNKKTSKRVLFSHAPDNYRLWEWDINIHGHIHNNDHRDDPLINKNRDYRNVSVEVMGYQPVRLSDILGGYTPLLLRQAQYAI